MTPKFAQNPALSEQLCTTDGPIMELNWSSNTYWGADVDTGEGKNKLGRIFMDVRDTLQAM